MANGATLGHIPPFSDYIVYVDESGDHGMVKSDPQYPIFVLAFCVMHKQEYINSIVPKLQSLKYKHWGHDMVVLHEHEIRKAVGDFTFLLDKDRRTVFMQDINELIEQSSFTVIAGVVRKDHLSKVSKPPNPYHLALGFCLEQLDRFLRGKGEQEDRLVHIVFEARGDKEDKELELEFRRLCDGENCRKSKFNFKFVLAQKRVNSCGLQLADLIARPIGIKVFKDQPNRAYDLIEPKLDRSPQGEVKGYGLQCFPIQK